MKKLFPLALALLLLLSACAATSAENKPYEITYQDVVYAGTYTGGVQKKLPNGEGTFTFDDGTNTFTYTGQWAEGKPSGNGKLVDSEFLLKFTDHDRKGKYEGDTIDGVPNGTGTFTATNDEGETYSHTGEFKNGTPNGTGKCIWEDSTAYNEIGTFTNGDFTPTPSEMFAYLGQRENATYGIRALSAEFLSANENMFTTNSQDGLDAFVDTEYLNAAYTKSPDKYGDKLIKQKPLLISQISENAEFNYNAVTRIIARDSDYNIYYIFLLGSVDVYEGDYITAYLLPLDYFTYDNVGGGQTWAVACAAAYITK